MRFAHLGHVWGKPRHDAAPALRAALARARSSPTALGFDYGFCVEHHFTPIESWMSAPNLYRRGGRRAHAPPAPGRHGPCRGAASSGAPRRGDRDRRPDARRPARGRPRARHPAALFRALRRRLPDPPRDHARIRALPQGRLRQERAGRFRRQAHQAAQLDAQRQSGAAAASADVDGDARHARRSNSARARASIPAISCSSRAPRRRRAMRPISRAGATMAGRACRTSPIRPSSMSTRPTRRRSTSALDYAGQAYKGFFSYSDDPDEIRTKQQRDGGSISSSAASPAPPRSS